MLIAVLVFVACAIQRIALAQNAGASFDTYGHIYYARELREQRQGPFGSIAVRVVGGGRFRHPFLWHWFVARCDSVLVLRHQRLLNPLLDAFWIAVFYVLSPIFGFTSMQALATAVLYVLTPMWFSGFSTGPRILSLTPRLASEIATNGFFLASLAPVAARSAGWSFAAAVALAFIVLASSKFGVQAMVFLTPLAALVGWSWRPPAALAVAAALCVIASRGEFLRTLVAQAHHLLWYFRKNMRGEMTISNRNRLGALFSRAPLRTWIRRLVVALVAGNSYAAVVVKMPVLLAALWFSLSSNTVPPWLVGPILAGSVLLVVINWRPLLFLGEAERYLNHVAIFVPMVAVLGAATPQRAAVLYGIAGWGVLFWLAEVAYRLSRSTRRTPAEDQVLSTLQSLPRQSVVLLYPFTSIGIFRVLLETQHQVIDTAIAGKAFLERFEARYAQDYPYVNIAKLDEMADELGVDVVVASKADLAKRSPPGWAPTDRWKRLPAGEPKYRVWVRPTPSDRL